MYHWGQCVPSPVTVFMYLCLGNNHDVQLLCHPDWIPQDNFLAPVNDQEICHRSKKKSKKSDKRIRLTGDLQTVVFTSAEDVNLYFNYFLKRDMNKNTFNKVNKIHILYF